MELKKMNYELKLPAQSILPFEQRMLESGLCGFAMPMRFVRSDAALTVRYECCGYIALEDLGILPPGLAFEILEKVFLALRSSFDCLLNPRRMILGLDLVCYHPDLHSVRILYLPGDAGPGETGSLEMFLDSFRALLTREGLPYLERLVVELSTRNRSLREMANLTGEIRREIYDAGLS